MFQLWVETKRPNAPDIYHSLTLVDLAGSERINHEDDVKEET